MKIRPEIVLYWLIGLTVYTQLIHWLLEAIRGAL